MDRIKKQMNEDKAEPLAGNCGRIKECILSPVTGFNYCLIPALTYYSTFGL